MDTQSTCGEGVENHGRCLFRRVLLVVLPVRSNADLRALIVCTISSTRVPRVSKSLRHRIIIKPQRTGELGVFRLELVPLVRTVPRAAMDDDAERGRGRLAGLAREEAVDVVGRRLAVVENRLGGLVRRRHDLNTHKVSSGRNLGGRASLYVDVGPVDRERAFLLSDDHRHFSVHGVFLEITTQRRGSRVFLQRHHQPCKRL
jgi:hypothetical protein